MATYDQMLLASIYNGTQGHMKLNDYFPLMWVKCVNPDYPNATVAVNAGGDIAFTTDGDTADTTISTDGTIDLSTPGSTENSLGEVADIINGSANWVCVILGGIRAMLVDGLFYTCTEQNASGINGVILYGDTTASQAAFYYGFAISAFDPTLITTKPTDGSAPDPDSGCQSIATYVQWLINYTSAGYLKIYSSTPLADNLIFQSTLIDNTSTPNGVLGGPPVWKSRFGERLVILLYSDASMTSTAGALVVQGHSIDWANRRFVSGYTLTNAAG